MVAFLENYFVVLYPHGIFTYLTIRQSSMKGLNLDQQCSITFIQYL